MTSAKKSQNIFVIEITYTAGFEIIERSMEAHRAFLAEHYKNKTFLASGPKVPRDGGIILAQSADRATIEKLVEADPFKIHDLAQYTISEFIPRMKAFATTPVSL